MQIFFILQDHPTFRSEERLVNSVRGRERFVGLSILLCSVFYKITPLATQRKGWSTQWEEESALLVYLCILECSTIYKITPFFHSEERLIQLNKRKIVLCWAISIIYLRLSSSCCRSASRFIFSSSSLSLDWVFTLSDLPTAPTLNQYMYSCKEQEWAVAISSFKFKRARCFEYNCAVMIVKNSTVISKPWLLYKSRLSTVRSFPIVPSKLQ